MLSVLEIGGKIAVARKMKNYSQAQLADLLAVSAQAVGKWERGESMPDIVTFGRLAEILGVDLNYFGNKEEVPVVLPNTSPSAQEDELNKSPGWNMSGSNWTETDFSGLHGLAEKFSGSNIQKCQFIRSELSGLVLRGNNIHRSDFTDSDLRKCKLSGTNFETDIFTGCNFTKSVFARSNIKNCDFRGADMTDVLFKWCHFQKGNLSDAVLSGTTFQSGQLSDLTFNGEITDCSFINCDFARVTFQGAMIKNTFFKNSKLKRAKFINCKADKLTYAFMKSCKADLSDVEMIV